MSNETKVERDRNDSTNGNTDYDRLKNMTEEEIEKNAKEDKDNPLHSDKELEKFKRINPK